MAKTMSKRKTIPTCQVPECDRAILSLGLCGRHYTCMKGLTAEYRSEAGRYVLQGGSGRKATDKPDPERLSRFSTAELVRVMHGTLIAMGLSSHDLREYHDQGEGDVGECLDDLDKYRKKAGEVLEELVRRIAPGALPKRRRYKRKGIRS